MAWRVSSIILIFINCAQFLYATKTHMPFKDEVEVHSTDALCVKNMTGMTSFFKSTMDSDFFRWINRPKRTVGDLDSVLQHWWDWQLGFKGESGDQDLFLVYENKVYFPSVLWRPCAKNGPPSRCSVRHQWVRAFLEEAIQEGVTFPNVVFWMGTWDLESCVSTKSDCAVPRFAFGRNAREVSTFETTGGLILVPEVGDIYHGLYNYPWHLKKNVSFFRGGQYCRPYNNAMFADVVMYAADPSYPPDGGYDNARFWCSRNWVYNYAKNYVRHANLLDARRVPDPDFTPAKRTNFVPVSQPPESYTIADHARFKFLLSLDGNTFSSRLAKLLHTNSVVLKEESPWREYFYAALTPGVHYLPIFNTSLFDLFDVQLGYNAEHGVQSNSGYKTPHDLPWKDRQRELRLIAKSAQTFAATYLCAHARRLYWKQALLRYKDLFRHNDSYNAMDDYIENTVWPAMSSPIGALLPRPDQNGRLKYSRQGCVDDCWVTMNDLQSWFRGPVNKGADEWAASK